MAETCDRGRKRQRQGGGEESDHEAVDARKQREQGKKDKPKGTPSVAIPIESRKTAALFRQKRTVPAR